MLFLTEHKRIQLRDQHKRLVTHLESHFYLYVKFDFVQFCDGISERIAGPFFLFLLINSAFGYEFRKKRKKLQSASSGSARQKLYKVELKTSLPMWIHATSSDIKTFLIGLI